MTGGFNSVSGDVTIQIEKTFSSTPQDANLRADFPESICSGGNLVLLNTGTDDPSRRIARGAASYLSCAGGWPFPNLWLFIAFTDPICMSIPEKHSIERNRW